MCTECELTQSGENSDGITFERLEKDAFEKDRILFIVGTIDFSTALVFNRLVEVLLERDRSEKFTEKRPITIHIDTPGGDIFSGLSIVSTILSLREMGYVVNSKTYSACMSMGVLVSAVCTNRFSQKFTRFMLHSIASFSVGEVRTSLEGSKRQARELHELWEKFEGLLLTYTNIDKTFLDKLLEKEDEYNFWPEKAIEFGLIDYIV